MAQPVLNEDGTYSDRETGKPMYEINGRLVLMDEVPYPPFDPSRALGSAIDWYMRNIGEPFAGTVAGSGNQQILADMDVDARRSRIIEGLLSSASSPAAPAARTAAPAAPTAAPAAAPAAPRTPYPGTAAESVNEGMRIGQQNQQLGLFGNLVSNIFDNPVIGRAVDRLLQYSIRPEAQARGPGDTMISQLARGAYGVQKSQAAQAAAQQAAQQKFAQQVYLEQIKAAAKAKKPGESLGIFNPEQVGKDVMLVQGTSRYIENIQEMLNTLNAPGMPVGGLGGAVATAARNVFATFANIDPSNQQTFEKKRAEIIAALNEQRVFGSQVSEADYKVIEQLVLNPGIFTTDSQLRKNLQDILKRAVSNYQNAYSRLKVNFGGVIPEGLIFTQTNAIPLRKITKP